MDFEITTNSPQQTINLGKKIGSQLKGGEIIALCGTLGSGKTHLIKGIASGAGATDSERIVNSPTFVIVNQYSGKFDIYHIDAYRINSISEFELLGFDDFCYPNSIVLIEWADKVESALKTINCVKITLSHSGLKKRKINIKNSPRYITL